MTAAEGRPRPNIEVFAATLTEVAETDDGLLAVCSDSRGSGKLNGFTRLFPDRIIEVGIAEQNLVGVAAGLALAGKRVFAVSPAAFLTARALEQIKTDICYSDLPVVLVGISAGLSYGPLGSTHHGLHDFTVLRAVGNIIICAPADNEETVQATRRAAVTEKPVYLRFGKRTQYSLPRRGQTFEWGKAVRIREGNDVSFIAAGETVAEALEAAELLQEQGIEARVISMHTIKPLDAEAVISGLIIRSRALWNRNPKRYILPS